MKNHQIFFSAMKYKNHRLFGIAATFILPVLLSVFFLFFIPVSQASADSDAPTWIYCLNNILYPTNRPIPRKWDVNPNMFGVELNSTPTDWSFLNTLTPSPVTSYITMPSNWNTDTKTDTDANISLKHDFQLKHDVQLKHDTKLLNLK